MFAPKPYKSETELIDACKKHNRSAQRYLYDKYSARMYAVCLKYARSAEVAKDYLQDGFVTVFTRMDSYSIGAEQLAILRHLDDIGIIPATGVPDCRHFVDIYTKLCSHNQSPFVSVLLSP